MSTPESAGKENSASAMLVYRRLIAGMLKHWRYMVLSMIGMSMSALSDTGIAAIMKPMIDRSFLHRDPGYVRWIPLAMLGIFLVRGVGYYLSNYYMAYVSRSVVREMRRQLFDHLLRMPVTYFDTNSAGTIISKLTFNVDQITQTSTKSFSSVVTGSLTILGLLGWMFYINWFLTLCFLTVAPVIAVVVSFVSRRMRRVSRRIQGTMGIVTQAVDEAVQGHKVIKAGGGIEHESQRFDDLNERNMHHQLRLVRADASSVPIIQFILGLALAGIVFMATFPSAMNTITVDTFVSFMVAMMMLVSPVRELTRINVMVQKGIAAAQSIYGLLSTPPEQDDGQIPIARARGDIELKQVNFAYDPAKGQILKDVCLHVPAGKVVALVGRSGAGKSTILNLLPRFYEPQSGTVLLDGVDVREYPLKSLREQIAYVSQDVVLFNDTIANNIAYGSMTGIDRERVWEAVRAAHAEAFIRKLPNGLDTMIGDNGVLLSGGQRQRIAIARALLRDAPVLLLDEATSSLDSESERHIQDALENLLKNRTTLVIAHRLSTVEHADCIIVMHEGQIAESGTHAELLAMNGHYAQLHRTQFQHRRPPARVTAVG